MGILTYPEAEAKAVMVWRSSKVDNKPEENKADDGKNFDGS